MPTGTTEKSQYALRLYFAEPDDIEAGQRVFDVKVGDAILAADLDSLKEAGGSRRMLVKEFTGIRKQGKLKVEFIAKRGEPVVCGLELVAESLKDGLEHPKISYRCSGWPIVHNLPAVLVANRRLGRLADSEQSGVK